MPAAVEAPPPPARLRSPYAAPLASRPGAPAPLQPLPSSHMDRGSWASAGAGGRAAESDSGTPRKAEMYLVRTDGFTCTRETVKGARLAPASARHPLWHPS
jgi:hypothetical protein